MYLFLILDGHLGYAPAIFIREHLPPCLKARLHAVLLAARCRWTRSAGDRVTLVDEQVVAGLVAGALEHVFQEVDCRMEREHWRFNLRGGSTCLACVLIGGSWRLVTANAGDSRALLISGQRGGALAWTRLTRDCSPLGERDRIYSVIAEQPTLKSKSITTREYHQPYSKKELGRPILYRDPSATGWSVKVMDADDLKQPVISHTSHKGRLLDRLGVVRGLGNFRLRSTTSNTLLKPFFSARPDLCIISVRANDAAGSVDEPMADESSLLIVATDGVWDVCSAEDVTRAVADVATDDHSGESRPLRVARTIVARCRGQSLIRADGRREYRMPGPSSRGKLGSDDDISVLVLALHTQPPFPPC